MFIISHRGNLQGPDLNQENKPEYIDEALSKGFDVEVDVRFLNKSVFLGHDDAQYLVNLNWLNERKKKFGYIAKISKQLKVCKILIVFVTLRILLFIFLTEKYGYTTSL
jgi:hypothetical protein